MVSQKREKIIGLTPDVRDVEEFANEIISVLGEDCITQFNLLPKTRKLLVLRCLAELNLEADKRSWSDEQEESIRKAILDFTRSSLESPEGVRIAGAVSEIATSVESVFKHVFRLIIEVVYKRNYAQAQNELKLPTRDFRKMSLGRIVNAFRNIKEHQDFEFMVLILTDEWIERIEEFSKMRNTWLYGGVSRTLSGDQVIDEARRVLVLGIILCRWIWDNIFPILEKEQQLHLPDRRGGRGNGIFLSHSSKDKDVAKRIALGLSALNYSVWYDEWAIAPSQSIVEKINEGLAKNDILILLLSPNSVTSRWVQREVNATLMAQLSGQNVRIVPILLEECDIPAILSDIKYIDFIKDFQTGFIQLLEFLKSI